MNRVIIVLAVVAILATLAIGTLQTFTVTASGVGAQRQVHCKAPFYGAGSDLSGADAKACDDEATRRAETSGVISLGIAVGALVLTRVFRTRP